MNPTLEITANFLLRVAPGLILGAVMIFVTRREPRLRIVIYLALFVLLRDAMAPLGLWSFGKAGGFWIRLHRDPSFLYAGGLVSLAASLALYYFDRANRDLFAWRRGKLPLGLLAGLCAAFIVVAPLAIVYQSMAIEARGGPVPRENLPALLTFALMGNLLEEALFRGYVYGQLAQWFTPLKAGLASGIVFAFCHIFLAITVTDVGIPLLAFTLWEGLIAGVVGAKWGVLSSTLTHGGAIFLLSSGLI